MADVVRLFRYVEHKSEDDLVFICRSLEVVVIKRQRQEDLGKVCEAGLGFWI